MIWPRVYLSTMRDASRYRVIWLALWKYDMPRWAIWFNRLTCRYRPGLGFEFALVDERFALSLHFRRIL